jgi:CheY-like chemotaxis protein
MRGPPILLVDDDALIRDLLASVLEEEGYEVVEAQDGEEALIQLQRIKPALILLDLQMPRMNGWAFIKHAKAEGLSVPIVVMSAVLYLASEAQKLGAVDCLDKPFELKDLIDKVASYVPPPPTQDY